MNNALSQNVLEQVFTKARTYNTWLDKPVSDELLHQIYDLAKFGATSANSSPARFIFVKSKVAKERLRPTLMAGNVEKTMAAPVTVIVAHDLEFYEKLPKLFPHMPDAKNWFSSDKKAAEVGAFRNGSLQGAYLMLAARILGLDCGPMSGFDNAKVDEVFFAGTAWKSNFLCNLGYGDSSKNLFPRGPRLDFEEACRIE